MHTEPGYATTNNADIGTAAKTIVEEFLRIIMMPDPVGA